MELRNLHRRARPFRYLSLWSMAAIALLLHGGPRPGFQILPAAAFCLVWPLLVDGWFRWPRRSATGAVDARRVIRMHLLECLLFGLVFGWLSLPPAGAFAALLALLAGVTAQAGWSLCCAAIPFIGVGMAAGVMAAPAVTRATTLSADLAAAVFMLAFVVALADVSFRQAQRLRARERSALVRAHRLESMTLRMEPYLAPSLRARLRAAPDPGQPALWRDRRWLTVVFVDLVGFTALAARLDAETLAAILDEYLAAVCELALRQGGEVTKVLGDGVLIAFGIDGAQDRRTLAAAAVSLCRALPSLVERLEQRWRQRGDLVEFAIRAGVASGYCTVGDWGGAYRDFTMIGTPVNLASRLQAGAPAGGVLIDSATAALLEDDTSLGPQRSLTLRGLGDISVHLLECAEPVSGVRRG